MTIIVDPSVALKWVIEEDGSEAAEALLRNEPLAAPDLFVVECANVLWAKTRCGVLTRDRARMALAAIQAARSSSCPRPATLLPLKLWPSTSARRFMTAFTSRPPWLRERHWSPSTKLSLKPPPSTPFAPPRSDSWAIESKLRSPSAHDRSAPSDAILTLTRSPRRRGRESMMGWSDLARLRFCG
jgi:hypothetical protein